MAVCTSVARVFEGQEKVDTGRHVTASDRMKAYIDRIQANCDFTAQMPSQLLPMCTA
jgi:hypothetical protein